MRWRHTYDWPLFPVLFGVLALVTASCAYPKEKPDGAGQTNISATPENFTRNVQYEPEADKTKFMAQANPANRDVVLSSLENLIEMERSGSFTQGMGLRESMFRETLGDPAGAVAAAYKELAFAYGMGMIDKAVMVQSMQNADALGDIPSQAARGCLAFIQGRWAESKSILDQFYTGDEIDSFFHWMILCCTLEQNRSDKQAADVYRAIRGRYVKFPEYLYRGARAFSGLLAAEYAEFCVALAPAGPFAEECRTILAASAGLSPRDGQLLLSRPEIEQLISRSVNQGDPSVLDQLLPLISLPDNTYTAYAVDKLRTLAPVPMFRDYFRGVSDKSTGRLAERLAYISRAGL
jgi:hypothetical protein